MTDFDKDPTRNSPSAIEPDDLQYRHDVVSHADLPETKFSAAINTQIKRFGSMISWFWIVLMMVICTNVFMKNVLGQGSVRFEEIQWHIFSALFLMGLCYTMAYDDHVRVDLFYEQMSLKSKAWVDAIGILVFLLPFIGVLLYFGEAFVLKAFADNERSNSPAGLSHYWIIKSTLLIGLCLLAVAAIARLHICVAYLFWHDDTQSNNIKEG